MYPLSESYTRILLTLAVLLAPLVSQAQLSVVTTTPNLGAIAEVIGGDRVSVTTLAKGGEDPHFVRPRPSFIPVLNRADVLIEVGAELEASWLPPIVRTARNRTILPGGSGHIVIAQHIELMGIPTGRIDRSMGDVHAAGNPHFMLDPENGRIAAGVIADHLSQLDPEGGEIYARNLKEFRDELDERLKGWRRELAPFEGTELVTYHKSYDYLARCFGFRVVAQIEPLPGIEPSPRHILGLISSMQKEKIRMIWVEPFRPLRTAQRVAEQTGAHLVLLPEQVGAVEGTDDYFALIDYNVRQIIEAMTEE